MALNLVIKVQCQVIFTKQGQSNNWFYNIFQEQGTSNILFSNSNYTINEGTNELRTRTEVITLNTVGNLISSKQLDSNFFYNQILRLNNNYFILGEHFIYYSPGNSAHLIEVIKYDLNFNKLKKVVIDSFYNRDPEVVKLISKQNSMYAGYMSNQQPDTFNLYKLDANLNKLDSFVDIKGALFDILNIGNDLIICGRAFFQNGSYPVSKLARIDTSFNLIWQFHLDSLDQLNTICGTYYPKIELNNTHVIGLDSDQYFVRGNEFAFNGSCNLNLRTASAFISGNKKIRKLHLIGNDSLLSMCSGGFLSSSLRFNNIYTTALTGYDNLDPFPPQTNNTYILVTKMDTAGNLIWFKYIGGDKYYMPQSIYATNDSGFVICGMRYDHETPQVENICEGFVMKLDKNGETNFVGIQENGKLNFSYHKCFPNPVKDELRFDIPLQQIISLVIFDVNGKQLKKIDNYENLSTLKLTEFTPGVYSYKILSTVNTYYGKFVKE